MSSTFSPAMANAYNYNQWTSSYYQRYIKGDLLEIGIGHGSFCDILKGYTSYSGLDIDPNLISDAQKRYPSHHYYLQDLGDDHFHLSQKFDTIICFNVLEHIENDKMALKNMLSTLKQDGSLIIFVPAFQFLWTDMDVLAGHHRRYVISDFSKLSKELPCRIEAWSYFNPIGGCGVFVQKFQKINTLHDDSLNKKILMFDRYGVPLSKLLNPLTKKIFGQSLFLVLKNID
jgi:SAM-dependent methyltransferase